MFRYLLLVYLLLITFAPGYFQNEFALMVGSSALWRSDIILIALWIIELIDAAKREGLKIERRNLELLFFGLFIGLYALISIIQDRSFSSVVRDSRVGLMIIIPISLCKIRSVEDKFLSISHIIKLLILFFILFFYISLLFNMQIDPKIGLDVTYDTKHGVIKHNIGITSTIFWICIAGIISFYKTRNSEDNYFLNILFTLLALIQVFYYAIRIITWAYVLVIMLILILYIKRIKSVEVFFVAFLLVFFLSIKMEGWQKIKTYPQIERFISLLNPTYSTAGNDRNRQYRLDAIKIAFHNTPLLFGNGFGNTYDIDKSKRSKNKYANYQAYFNHSAYSFALYKFGFLGSIIIAFIYIFLPGKQNVKSYFYSHNNKVYFFITIFFLIVGFGTNNFFRGDFMTIQIFYLIGLSIKRDYDLNHTIFQNPKLYIS